MTLGQDFMDAYDGINYGLLAITAIVCFVVCMFLVVREKKKENNKLCAKHGILCLVLTLYLSFVLAGTLINRLPDPINEGKLILFWSYWEMIFNNNENMWKQILYNIFIFIPWGILLPLLYTKAKRMRVVILSAFIFSAVIEIIQLIFRLGFFEFDDIFHNTLGALLGYGLWMGLQRVKRLKRS